MLIQLAWTDGDCMTAEVPMLPVPLLERTSRHLMVTLTPEEHKALWDRYLTSGGVHYTPDDDELTFWEALPEYLIARCPFCGASYAERMDTHSLASWLSGLEGCVYWSGAHQRVGCRHFTGVQRFINLSNFTPAELTYFEGDSEVPYVMPLFLPDDPISYAVMHCLPICRVEEGKFVPRYSLFILTYYSKNPDELLRRRLKDIEEFCGDDPDCRVPIMYTWREASREAWDLPLWLSRGKLWWLDIDRDDLPLKSGPAEAFPYGNIHGIRREFTYRNGELTVAPW